MNKNILTIVSGILLFSCVTKNNFYEGDKSIEFAQLNAIEDFVNTYKTPYYYIKKRKGRPFDTFIIREWQFSDNLYTLTFIPTIQEISLSVEDSLGKVPRTYFPNRYVEKKGKLFLWNDGITLLQKDILEIMDKYKILDSIDVKKELGLLPKDYSDERVLIMDSRLKAVNYYICKSNIRKYKKVITNKAVGYYEPPKLECNR